MFSSCFSYEDKKRVSLWMMQQGLGYKRISNLLGLKLYTVRDYGRRFKKGEFSFGFNSPLKPEDDTLIKIVELAKVKTSYSLERICSSLSTDMIDLEHDKERRERKRSLFQGGESRSNSTAFEPRREIRMGNLSESDAQGSNQGLRERSYSRTLLEGEVQKKRLVSVETLLEEGYSVKAACKKTGVPRSKYYRSLKLTKKELSDCLLLKVISDIQEDKHIDFTYGILRITAAVNSYLQSCSENERDTILCGKEQVNHKRIQRLLKENNLNAKIKRPTMPKNYYKSKKEYEKKAIVKNQLNRNFFSSESPFTNLATDVTYLPCTDVKFIYLSPLMDLYNQEIISFEISYKNSSEMVETMLKKMPKGSLSGSMVHSDQGSVYTSKSWIELCKELNINRSMSRRGNCWDNSVMEGFFSRLKSDLRLTKRENKVIYDSKTVIRIVKDYINWYNNDRIQRRLGYTSPVKYREMYENQNRA